MELIPVVSSNLSAVGYDQANQYLYVRFKNGLNYRYLQVPQSLFDALMKSSSKGTFFNDKIKDRFKFVKR
ncbi:MAG: hypothetical protein FD144_4034 [Rhodospirillaceae bacterium]|jgi:hypothetical protein|nr:MAG: hypothetical protein FD144_4034 [Rhodospirillaceae bacterium]